MLTILETAWISAQIYRLLMIRTNIFITGKNIQSVYFKTNLELKNIHEWMTANKLTVNSAKTKYLFLLLEKVIIPSQIHGLKYILEIILLKKFHQFAF